MGMKLLTELQSALRRELETGELLDLEEDFYDNVQNWLKSLSTETGRNTTELPDELAERAKATVKKLLILRLTKELNYLWTHGVIPEKRLPKQEAALLKSILSILSKITCEEAKEQEEVPEREDRSTALPVRGFNMMALVSFKKPYTKLVLSNGKLLGPFSIGDIAVLPLSDADMLARDETVEIIMSFTV
ncbi:MAG: hypothetical protein QXZ31_01965 [Thermofilaceae archaeon]